MSGINEALKELAGKAAGFLKKALGQELVKQYTNPDPKNKKACFFTAFYMYFRTVHKYRGTFAEYKAACIAAGACNEAFTILDHSLMAKAAGQAGLVCKNTSTRLKEKIFELLLKGEPVVFSLNGEHYESIDGYETTEENKLRFTVDDPGWQNDAFADADELQVYRETKPGVRSYSVPNSGKGRRTITRVYWFEKG